MFWNKKEEKRSLPDLPPLRSPFSKDLSVNTEQYVPQEEQMEDKEENIEKHALPSFPDSPIDKGFSQAAIKEAVSSDEKRPEDKINIPKKPEKIFKTIELEEPDTKPFPSENPYLNYSKIGLLRQPTPSIKSPAIDQPPVSEQIFPDIASDEDDFKPKEQRLPNTEKNQDIFVKIDKFYSGKKALESIKQQVNQIDDLLKKIRDTKIKEENELSNWEKEIVLIKSRIQNVNDNIFEKTS